MATRVKERAGRPRRIRVSSKNQITIPVSVLTELGAKAGDELEIIPRGQEATIRRAGDPPWVKFFGSLPRVWPPGEIDRRRGEWER